MPIQAAEDECAWRNNGVVLVSAPMPYRGNPCCAGCDYDILDGTCPRTTLGALVCTPSAWCAGMHGSMRYNHMVPNDAAGVVLKRRKTRQV